jgi:hypothetical protein
MTKTVKDNWMSKVDLATYKWTLYLANPSVYNNPDVLAQNDSAALNSGQAIVIAESGVTGSYSLENVIIQSTITPGNESGSATPTGVVFELYEPLGFSLLDRLLTVGQSMGYPSNIMGLNYVLKLEFLGRDGRTGSSTKFPGIFLWKTRISGIKGSLGPAGAKYFITAMFDIRAAQINSVTKVDTVVSSVNTVQSFAENLQATLNQMEQDLLPPVEIRRGEKPQKEWHVVLDDSTSIQADPNLGITSFDLKSQAWAGTINSDTSSSESANTENPDTRDIVINSETQLSQKIAQLISANVPGWSTYVNESRELRFYVPYVYVDMEQEVLDEVDETLAQSRLKITLTIKVGINKTTEPDSVQQRKSLQTSQGLQQQRFNNLDIVKKYNYLYTGENTEVLDFQLDIESLFVVATAPAAGIYYADNSQQFVPINPVRVSQNSADSVELTERQKRNANARFLSDIELEKININHQTPFERVPASASTQQKNEHTGLTDDIAAVIAQQTAKRTVDNLNISLEIRGDPFWLGTPDVVIGGSGESDEISNFNGNDALIGIVSFQPNEKDLLIDQRRGPVDMISSGLYNITHVESKFQQGQFTQTLTGYKDPNTNVFLTLDQLISVEVI